MATHTDRLKLVTPSPGQCNWDWDWERNQQINDVVSAQDLNRSSVVSGGNLSGASGLSINIDETVVIVGGNEFTVSAQAVSLVAAVVNPEERNWIYVDDVGALISSTTPPSGLFALIGLVDTDLTQVVRQSDLRRQELVIEHTPVENLFINGRFEHNQRWGIGGDAYIATAGALYTADRFTHRSNGYTSKTSFDGDGDPFLLLRHDTLTRATFAICQPFRIVPLNNSRFRVGDKLTLAFEIHPEDGGVGNPTPYLDAHFSSSLLTVVRPQTITSEISTITVGLYTRVVATITIISLPDDADTALFVSFGCEYASPAAVGTKVFFKNTTLIDGNEDLPVRRRTEEEELKLCQDYYFPLFNSGTLQATILLGQGIATTRAIMPLYFPFMIQNPSLVYSGVADFSLSSATGGIINCTALSISNFATKGRCRLDARVVSGLQNGDAVYLFSTIGAANLALNSEI